MDKVLIVTYYWPPSAGSGVQRWLKFCKYLPQFGMKPIVFTPLNPHFSINDQELLKEIPSEVEVLKLKIWEPYRLAEIISGGSKNNEGLVKGESSGIISKLLNYIRANYFIPDPRKFWVRPAVKKLKKVIQENSVEYIITTGPPHSMHLIGLGIKKLFPHIKWIVDIRDPWSKFDFLKNYGSNSKALYKQAKLEKKVLDSCDIVLSTSYSMKNLLVSFDQMKFRTLTNGFDKSDFEGVTKKGFENRIIICHAGLLNQLRNPNHLWSALDQLCLKNSKIDEELSILLIGTMDEGVLNEIKSYENLNSKLIIETYKSHDKVIEHYLESDVLLLLVNNSDNADANIPGKLFEYMASKKPIISISEESTDAYKILKGYSKHLNFQYSDAITGEKLKLLEQFLVDSKSSFIIEPTYYEQYERKSLTETLVSILNDIN